MSNCNTQGDPRREDLQPPRHGPLGDQDDRGDHGDRAAVGQEQPHVLYDRDDPDTDLVLGLILRVPVLVDEKGAAALLRFLLPRQA